MLIIVDNLSIHKANKTKDQIAENLDDREMSCQPTYAPNVKNRVELLWALIKDKESQYLSQTKAQIRDNLKAVLESMKESRKPVQAFFREKDCKYILGSILVTKFLHRSVANY